MYMSYANIAPNAGMGILDTFNADWIRLAGAAGGHSVMVMVASRLGAVETQAAAVTETSVVGGVPGRKSFSAMGGALVEREVEVRPVVAELFSVPSLSSVNLLDA